MYEISGKVMVVEPIMTQINNRTTHQTKYFNDNDTYHNHVKYNI